MASDKNGEAWQKILSEKHKLLADIKSRGYGSIKAEEIKYYREPRLMTKFDAKDQMPKPLSKLQLGVLATSRFDYCVGEFDVFKSLPDLSHIRPEYFKLPTLETLNAENITSESNSINAMVLSGILDDFIGSELGKTYATFNGRMGSGTFDCLIDRIGGGTISVSVDRAQIEIDGGFENEREIVVMEAKNVIHDNFNVRQLYYPYRRYSALVRKPVRLVFSQYTDSAYNLFEIRFTERDNFSSAEIMRQKRYTIALQELKKMDVEAVSDKIARHQSEIRNDDVPFPQADNFSMVVSICEYLNGQCVYGGHGAGVEELAEFMGLVPRQASYYAAAGRFIGLIDSANGQYMLSPTGRRIFALRPEQRTRDLIEQILSVLPFNQAYRLVGNYHQEAVYDKSSSQAKSMVMTIMKDSGICTAESTRARRAQTIIAWLRWIDSKTVD